MWWLWNPMMASGVATPRGAQAMAMPGALTTYGVQACCSWSPDAGFHHFSDNWYQVTGLNPKECMGNGWTAVWANEVQAEFIQLVHDLFHAAPEDRLESAILQGEMLRSETVWGYCECLMVPVGTPEQPQLTILVSDKTSEHHLRREAHMAQEESHRARQGRSSFLSNMSHELRTPLNAILGFSQLVEEVEDLTPEAQKEYIGYIRESGESLLGKINDLIEMANIDSRRCQLDEMAFNVKDALEAVVEMHSHTAFKQNQSIRLQLDQPHLVIRADRTKWMRCVSHLVSNALQHSPEAEEIQITMFASQEEGMCVKITDHGRGIQKERLSNIRDSLLSHQSYYATDITDIGIGLAVTRELMHLHGGRVELQSDPARGTTAMLFLPPERIVSLSARVKPKRAAAMKITIAGGVV